MAGYRTGRGRSGNRSGGYGRSAGTRSRSRRPVSSRRRVGTRRTVTGTKTVRLVIEQAAPTPQVVQTDGGKYGTPDNTPPKRAKF